MTSLKQIAANRRNALKSTGPTTQEGKAHSRRNAIRHGLTAETVIGGIEDAEDYQDFEASVIADYEGETSVERELALRLASVLWRLRRASGIEAALFKSAYSERLSQHPDDTFRSTSGRSEPNVLFLKADQVGKSSTSLASNCDTKTESAKSFLRLAELPTYPLDRLSRYEHLLWRQARQIVFALNSLQRSKGKSSRSSFPFSFRARNR